MAVMGPPPPKMAPQALDVPEDAQIPSTCAPRAQGHGKEETTMNPLELLLRILGLLEAAESALPAGPEADPDG